MSYKDFVDLKYLKTQLTSSILSKDIDRNNVSWLEIKIIQMRKSEPDKIFIKKNYYTIIPVALKEKKVENTIIIETKIFKIDSCF